METALKEQLWQYIISHNPDLMFELQDEYRVSEYLDEKVKSIMDDADQYLDNGLPWITVQELCLDQMTADLKPSLFLYVKEVLEQEFPIAFEALQQSYMLNYELLNILESCKAIFEKFAIEQRIPMNSKALRYAVMGEIAYYLS